MTTERDPGTRIVLSWLREEAHENAERVLLRALDEVETTPQRRSWWPALRTSRMHPFAKLLAAAAALLLVAVAGYQFLPRNGGIGGQPTFAPSPSPALLARGSFVAKGAAVELDASGGGDSVTGTMKVSHVTGDLTVDLKCTRTAGDGRILIGGDTTDSTSDFVTKGARSVIVLKPGSPVHAVFDFERGPPAASCLAFLEGMIDEEYATVIGPDALEPIEGTVEFGP
jgi:hypothetical protein